MIYRAFKPNLSHTNHFTITFSFPEHKLIMEDFAFLYFLLSSPYPACERKIAYDALMYLVTQFCSSGRDIGASFRQSLDTMFAKLI